MLSFKLKIFYSYLLFYSLRIKYCVYTTHTGNNIHPSTITCSFIKYQHCGAITHLTHWQPHSKPVRRLTSSFDVQRDTICMLQERYCSFSAKHTRSSLPQNKHSDWSDGRLRCPSNPWKNKTNIDLTWRLHLPHWLSKSNNLGCFH